MSERVLAGLSRDNAMLARLDEVRLLSPTDLRRAAVVGEAAIGIGRGKYNLIGGSTISVYPANYNFQRLVERSRDLRRSKTQGFYRDPTFFTDDN